MKPQNCYRHNVPPRVEQMLVKGGLYYMVICPHCNRHSMLCFRMENAINDWNTKIDKEKDKYGSHFD